MGGDTGLSTASAVDRSMVLVNIVTKITGGRMEKISKFSNSVSSEESQLSSLKNVLGNQGTLRPIFESQLKQKRLVRNRAMNLRRMIAEAGLDYDSLQTAFKAGTIPDKLGTVKATSEDVEEILKLVEEHFNKSTDNLENGNSH